MLNTVKLVQDLKTLTLEMSQMEDAEQAAEHHAQQLAIIITSFVKSGQVQTTGTAAAQTGVIL